MLCQWHMIIVFKIFTHYQTRSTYLIWTNWSYYTWYSLRVDILVLFFLNTRHSSSCVPEIVHVVLCNRHTFEIIHYTFNMKFNKDILRNLIYSYSSKLCNGLFRNWGRYHVGIDSFYVWHVNVLGILTSACDIVVAGGSVICIYLLWKQDVQVCICLLASNKSLYRLLKWSPMVYILPLL